MDTFLVAGHMGLAYSGGVVFAVGLPLILLLVLVVLGGAAAGRYVRRERDPGVRQHVLARDETGRAEPGRPDERSEAGDAARRPGSGSADPHR